jgi:plastocyanin domain-containing protein
MTTIRNLGSSACLAILALANACERNATNAPAESNQASPAASTVANLALTVDGSGYHPASFNAPANKPVRLVVTRTSDEGCGQQIVFPSLEIRRDLPLNREVPIDFTMPASGSVAFTCGMNMLRGSIVAQ